MKFLTSRRVICSPALSANGQTSSRGTSGLRQHRRPPLRCISRKVSDIRQFCRPKILVEFAPLPVRKQARAYGKQRRARRAELSGFAMVLGLSLATVDRGRTSAAGCSNFSSDTARYRLHACDRGYAAPAAARTRQPSCRFGTTAHASDKVFIWNIYQSFHCSRWCL